MDWKSIYMRCDCHAETIEFNKITHSDGDTSYEINVVDSYCGYDFMGLKNRFKRAWKAFFEQPICYTGLFTEDKTKIRQFFVDCIALIDDTTSTHNS